MTTTTQKKTTTKPKTTATKQVDVVNENLPPNPFVFEVLNVVSKQRTNAKKVELLRRYEHPSLKALFIWNFDESVISMLPAGAVPYSGYEDQVSFKGSMTDKVSEEIRKMHETGSISLGASDTQGRSTIRKEFKHFYHFIKGGNDGLNRLRRESMFINILEGLHPFESEILCLVKDKKLQERYKITKEIVSEAYPDITWGNRS
jgi:hypothetical protein